MGAPAIHVGYVMEKLKEIEIALCGHPCNHPECDMGVCTHPLRLVRELMKVCDDL